MLKSRIFPPIPEDSYFPPPPTKTCSLKKKKKNSVEIFFLGFFKQFKTRPDDWFGARHIRVCPRSRAFWK